MANLRKNIGRKRLIKKRENSLRRKEISSTESALKNVTVRAGQKIGLMETIENVKALRKEQNALRKEQGLPNLKPTSVYHRYGKNSVRRIKVTE